MLLPRLVLQVVGYATYKRSKSVCTLGSLQPNVGELGSPSMVLRSYPWRGRAVTRVAWAPQAPTRSRAIACVVEASAIASDTRDSPLENTAVTG
ncbi:MAG TPA: hypothetical protein VL403_08325, partial [Candidatus Kryptonia bacterium]|nr:hypothetical protein [Candidatus Kryptonia bacterium]